NSEDVTLWGDPVPIAFYYYLKDAFIGATQQASSDFLAAVKTSIKGDVKALASRNPTVSIRAQSDFHHSVVSWMAQHHPELQPKRQAAGKKALEPEHAQPETGAQGVSPGA